MTDDHLQRRPPRRLSDTLPLFYWKKTRAGGESNEISVGPCAVCIVRWTFGLIAVVMAVIFGGAQPTLFFRLLFRLLP